MKNFLKRIFGKKTSKVSAKKKHEYRYALQYGLIPELVSCLPVGRLTLDDLARTDVWRGMMENFYGEDYYFEWDELHCDKLRINDKCLALLYIFPKPEQVPDAALGAVLVNTETMAADYYTLELSFGGDWMIGCTAVGNRFNMGVLENPGVDSFLLWIKKQAARM